MADYTSLATVKLRLGRTDDRDDATLTAIITAASRHVDELCNRRFDTVTETRYFTPTGTYWAEVDDLVSVSAVYTDEDGDRVYEETWTATDYELEPVNAASRDLPYTRIEVAPLGTRAFPVVRRGLKVTATWGFSSVPSAIAEATTLLAIRLFKRVDAPYGIVGSADLGSIATLPRVDPDIAALIAPYRRFALGVI